jgi:hypothetical protein
MKTLQGNLFAATVVVAIAVALVAPSPAAATIISDNLIVQMSLCVGVDCTGSESFGFDTIRLKENNLRIKFEDTSVGSFPTNDWQLTANDSASGGASRFSIDDITGNKTPFTIRAGAPTNSIFVDSSGRLGVKTGTPVVDVHVKTGNTPTLRLEQDASSGFASQTWDVAGNETSFFIRDVTTGSRLPFRIRPGAPSSSIDIKGTGDVGIGTASPVAALDVSRTTASDKDMVRISNNGKGNFLFENTASTGTEKIWTMSHANNGVFAIDAGGGATELRLQQSGNLLISGALTTATTTYPDYVFEPSYELMPLDELQAFIEREKHLPNVLSSSDVDGGRSVNMSQLQVQLLEKVEELTLYTLAQQGTISDLARQNVELQQRLAHLEEAAKVD